jgi:predicted O-methyltransferase YrrM
LGAAAGGDSRKVGAVDLSAYAVAWLAEDPAIAAARLRARDAGLVSAGPDAGSLLRALAQLVQAKTVVETGTGAGVSALWLVGGLQPGGVLTSIDREPEYQRFARQAFAEAHIGAGRTRLIAGEASSVLPRLTDRGYDLVHLDCGSAEHVEQFPQALRLIRPGGVIAVSGILRGDPESKSFLEEVAVEHAATSALLPLGDGLLVVTTSTHSA